MASRRTFSDLTVWASDSVSLARSARMLGLLAILPDQRARDGNHDGKRRRGGQGES